MSKANHSSDLRALRVRLRMEQRAFWGKVGVSQSAGSRYENGRDVPPPVQMLLGHVYLRNRIRAHRQGKST